MDLYAKSKKCVCKYRPYCGRVFFDGGEGSDGSSNWWKDQNNLPGLFASLVTHISNGYEKECEEKRIRKGYKIKGFEDVATCMRE